MYLKKLLKKIVYNPSILPTVCRIFNHMPWNNSFKMLKKYNYLILSHFSILRKCKIHITLESKNNEIFLDTSCRLTHCTFYISGNNNKIYIGEKTRLNNTDFYVEDDNNIIQIGESTTIHGTTQIATIEGSSIVIGKDCMFSRNISMSTGDSHSIVNNQGERLNSSKDIIIGNHVWIGHDVTLLKGSQIPNNSIVGACTVVTKKFKKEGVILAGCPSTVIKEDVSWLRERI